MNIIKKDQNLLLVRTAMFDADIDSSNGFGYSCDTIEFDTLYNNNTLFKNSINIYGNISQIEIKNIVHNFNQYPFENVYRIIKSINRIGIGNFEITCEENQSGFYENNLNYLIYSYKVNDNKITICKSRLRDIDVIRLFMDGKCYEISK